MPEPRRWALTIGADMERAQIEFVWPGFPDAIPMIVIGVLLPAWLIYVVFRYTRLRVVWKLLLIPVSVIAPFIVSLLWPLIIKLSGLVKFTGPGDYDAPYTWYANELFGDYSAYVWATLTTFTILVLHRLARSAQARAESVVPKPRDGTL